MTPVPAGPAGLTRATMMTCRRCKRDMLVADNRGELTEEQKADALCQRCWETLMFNTSLG